MIETVLPAGVRWAEAFDDMVAPDWFPEEEALVARAVAVRRGEFATVRRCARQALAELGVPRVPLLRGPRGAPRWPGGIVGSMTHCAGYRGAAVARQEEFAALGIDAETDEPVPDEVWDMVALPPEREQALRALGVRDRTDGAGPGPCPDKLLFSAKEAVFKAWYPLTREELEFHEASVLFTYATARSGSFEARLLVPGPVVGGRRLDAFAGRWASGRGLILTAVALPVTG